MKWFSGMTAGTLVGVFSDSIAGTLFKAFLVAGLLISSQSGALAKPRRPLPPIPPTGPVLFSESFDEAYTVGATNAQVTLGNYTYAESWTGYALQRSGTITPFLIPGVDATGHTNLATSGAIHVWFKPDWSSVSVTNGTGPGMDVPLLEWTAVAYNQATVIWSLEVSADGSLLALLKPGNGGPVALLTNGISWQAGQWHLLTLDYGTSGTALFVDGDLVAQGAGTPSVSLAAAQLSVGSTIAGAIPAEGDFDEFSSFGRAQTTNDVTFYYTASSGQAALGPISEAEIEAWQEKVQQAASARRANARMASMSFGVFGVTGSSDCVTGGQPYITNLVATVQTNQKMTVSFGIAGGTNGVPYDIYTTTSLTNLLKYSQWICLGRGYTCDTYTFSNQPPAQSFYVLGSPPDMQIVTWGDDTYGQCDVPPGLTNVVAVSGGYDFSVALKDDGTVAAWGYGGNGETNVPPGLTNVTSIAAGGGHVLALLQNGTVVAWGANGQGQTNVPAGLTNVTAIAAGNSHSVALRSDGSVVAWGYNLYGQTNVPAGLGPVTQIAAGFYHSVALLANGTVVVWGFNGSVYGWNITNVPAGLSNVVSLAAGGYHTLAAKADGTVTAWGAGLTPGQYEYFGQSVVPAGLSNVVAVAGGGYDSLALQTNGTVVPWGDDTYDQTAVPDGLTGVQAIAAGAFHGLAIRSGPFTPLIIEEPINEIVVAGSTAIFSVTADSTNDTYQWQFNGTNISGATNAILDVTNVQSGNVGTYSVVISNGAGSITSSNATLNLLTAPVIVSTSPTAPSTNNITNNFTLSVNATATFTNEFALHYQWQKNGTNLPGATFANLLLAPSWSAWWQTNAVDGNYTVTVTNLAGSTNAGTWTIHYVSTPMPGMAVAWGQNTSGEGDYPTNLNVIALAAGASNSVAVLEGGSVVQWGYAWAGIPTNLSNAVAVSAGYSHTLALKSDGSVVSWGASGDSANTVPTNLTGVKAIGAGWYHNLALLTNGTVTAWGLAELTNVPSGLSNVTTIAAGVFHSLALRGDGTVVSWGDDTFGQTNVPAGLSNVVAVAGGAWHSLALKSDGTLVAWGDNESGQTNIPVGLSNVMAVAAGNYHSVALKNDGTVVTWGDDSQAQTNVPITLNKVKLVAAGGNHSLAGIFSPLAQYPVDVTKDLLLIYNTNSADSTTVLNYYLAHRPMVGGANVLGIGCSTNEIMLPADFTNQILSPYLTWLGQNPTKRPEYVILFLNIPSRVEDTNGVYPSVQYQLLTNTPGVVPPYLTSINMNGTNDCIGYIDKIATFGSNYSPGKVIISARAGGYNNTNYVVDSIRHGTGHIDNYTGDQLTVSLATNGLLASGVSTNSIMYADGVETIIGGTNYDLPHLTNGANVAGYISWGGHSSLGNNYAVTTGTNGVHWTGNSGWWVIQTIESFNGFRSEPDMGYFIQWYSSNAFGGTNYSNTPVGAISNVEEGGPGYLAQPYFGLWSAGKNLAISAWNSRIPLTLKSSETLL